METSSGVAFTWRLGEVTVHGEVVVRDDPNLLYFIVCLYSSVSSCVCRMCM